MLTIRMRRVGAKKKPLFRMVVTESRTAHDGAALEVLGHYNPAAQPETVDVDRQRLRYWVDRGAQLSDTVRTLVALHPETATGAAAEEAPAAEPAPAAEEAPAAEPAPAVEAEPEVESAEAAAEVEPPEETAAAAKAEPAEETAPAAEAESTEEAAAPAEAEPAEEAPPAEAVATTDKKDPAKAGKEPEAS